MVEEGVLLMGVFDEWGGSVELRTTEFNPEVLNGTVCDTLRINLDGKFPGFKRVVVQRGEDEVEIGADEFIAALRRIIEEEVRP